MVSVGSPEENQVFLDALAGDSERKELAVAQEERVAELSRTTKETDISLSLDIDGTARPASTRALPFLTTCLMHSAVMACSI